MVFSAVGMSNAAHVWGFLGWQPAAGLEPLIHTDHKTDAAILLIDNFILNQQLSTHFSDPS